MARNGYIQKSFTFDNKRYYVYGKNEREALEKLGARKAELERGRVVLDRNILVDVWAVEWLKNYKAGSVGASWLKRQEQIYNKFISPEIGRMRISSVKPLHIRRIIDNISGYSRAYQSLIYVVLKQIFRTAQENRLIEYDPMAGVKLARVQEIKTRRSITDFERQITLDVANYHRFGLFVLIMLYCGLRPQEIAPLKWRDIDLERKQIKVYQTLKADGTIKNETKSASGRRVVPIPEILLDRLKNERRTNNNYVCVNAYGRILSHSAIFTAWKNFKREMNIKAGCKVYNNQLIPPFPIADDLTLYCYRHTYCTDLQSAGVPINVARELMGHSSIEMTSRIYTHHSDVSINNAIDLINKYSAVQSAVQERETIEI